MSVQFGRWNFDGQPVDPEYIEKVNALLAAYGPDGCSSYSGVGTTILYHAFHTTKESRRETQPDISASGTVITWDGRLDNRAELIRDLADVVTASSTDVEIVAAGYEEWGENCFAKLIGDWAVSIWNPATRSLILAKDVIGTRHLYYAVEEQRITWSTILDPLVLLAGRKFQVCEEYIAGWLGFFPATHLTPYVGIDSVPPSSFVRLQRGKHEIRKYWDFDPHKRIRCRTDAEYEELFRVAFAESVRRRLRSDRPVLAELSGGMDSSSIVCMADEIIGRGLAETPRLDTISYYDDSEPNWNERPFFSKVEEKRGRTGFHVNVGGKLGLWCDSQDMSFAATPAERHTQTNRQLTKYADAHGNRALLSGVGGDEVMGGVPTPTPELMDLLARAQFRTLAGQLKAWALNKRMPWLRLAFEAARGFLPARLVGVPKHISPPNWLCRDFVHNYRAALTGYPARIEAFGSLPSFQDNLSTLECLRRQLACCPGSGISVGKHYPFLDRDLLEFMYAVPREQVVRPGQRRSLMRRALVGIVPDEVLRRSRKAFVVRSGVRAVSTWPSSVFDRGTTTASLRMIDFRKFERAIQDLEQGDQIPIVPILRTMLLGSWLQAVRPFATFPIAGNPVTSRQRAVNLPSSTQTENALRPTCK